MEMLWLLRDLGAEDREVPHLVACDECAIYNGHDGAEFERCPENPVQADRDANERHYAEGWALMRAFGLHRKRTWMDDIADQMRESIKAQVEHGLWFDRAVSSGAPFQIRSR